MSRFHRFLVAASLGVAAACSSGCIIVNDNPPPPTGSRPAHVDAVDIDISEGELTTDPGLGVSVIVEYAGSGRWNVNTTCDTETSQYACHLDLYVRGRGVRVLSDLDLEGNDYIEEYGDQLHAAFDTDYDRDGLTFDTPLGEEVEIEAYLDGDNAHPYVFWIGNGAIHEGAPTNPTVFLPQPQ